MSKLQLIIDGTLEERRQKGWVVFKLHLTPHDRPFYYAGDTTAKKILPVISNAVYEFGKQVDLMVKKGGDRGSHGECLASFTMHWVYSKTIFGRPKWYDQVIEVEVGHGIKWGKTKNALLINGYNHDEDIPRDVSGDEWFTRVLSRHYANWYLRKFP